MSSTSLRKKTEQAIAEARKVHGPKTYDYSKTVYTGIKSKITITCLTHGDFRQTPDAHIHGQQGCPECGTIARHASQVKPDKQFFAEVRKVHGPKTYDYSKTVYVGALKKITIICRTHGPFEQMAAAHLRGQGCPKCAGKGRTAADVVYDANAVHGIGTYDYSQVVYVAGREKITIICRTHGPFEQTPEDHIFNKAGCQKCGIEKRIKAMTWTTEEVITKANAVHGVGTYDYSQVVYVGIFKKVRIICRAHGPFEQSPHAHLYVGAGCPRCNESKGEKLIGQILEANGVKFVRQARIIPSRPKMAFDFYIPESRTLIEFHGLQHYASVKRFGGKKELSKVRARDRFKRRWAKANGYTLLETKHGTLANTLGGAPMWP